MKKTFGAIASIVALAAAAEARTIYEYNVENPSRSGAGAGRITELSAQYDTLEQVSFSATLDIRDDRGAANGGWFVFSPGNLPRRSDEELAIFYMDFAGGDLYAYRYNGLNSSSSWRDPSRYIATYEDVLSVENDGDSVTVSLSELFVGAVQSAVNDPGWTGAMFGKAFGGWIHFTILDEFAAENGRITAFDTGWQSYHDVADRPTQVPEPAGLALLGIAGALGAAAYRRRKS